MLLGLVRSSQAAIEELQATLVGYGERLAAYEGRQPQASRPARHLGGAGVHHLPASSSGGLQTLIALHTCWLLLLHRFACLCSYCLPARTAWPAPHRSPASADKVPCTVQLLVSQLHNPTPQMQCTAG